MRGNYNPPTTAINFYADTPSTSTPSAAHLPSTPSTRQDGALTISGLFPTFIALKVSGAQATIRSYLVLQERREYASPQASRRLALLSAIADRLAANICTHRICSGFLSPVGDCIWAAYASVIKHRRNAKRGDARTTSSNSPS